MNLAIRTNWVTTDFIIAGILLFTLGLLVRFIIKRIINNKNRFFYIIILVLLFLLIWVELGVGVFGTPFAGD